MSVNGWEFYGKLRSDLECGMLGNYATYVTAQWVKSPTPERTTGQAVLASRNAIRNRCFISLTLFLRSSSPKARHWALSPLHIRRRWGVFSIGRKSPPSRHSVILGGNIHYGERRAVGWGGGPPERAVGSTGSKVGTLWSTQHIMLCI